MKIVFKDLTAQEMVDRKQEKVFVINVQALLTKETALFAVILMSVFLLSAIISKDVSSQKTLTSTLQDTTHE